MVENEIENGARGQVMQDFVGHDRPFYLILF